MRPTIHHTVGAASLLLAICGTARAQHALGDGHALDANTNVNQGRYNPRAAGIDATIRFNNAVITGSAPGGKSFAGSVPYLATNQFGARLGSDDLYSFRRDSFNSSLASAGVRSSDALRYQFALTTGQEVPAYLAGNMPSSVARSGTVAMVSNVNPSAASLRSTSEFTTSRTFRPSLVGMRQDEWGAEYVAKASPLLGVTWVKTTESPLGAPASGTPAPAAPGLPGAIPTPTGENPPINPIPSNTAPGATPKTQPAFSGIEPTPRPAANAPVPENDKLDTRVKPPERQVESSAEQQVMSRFREGFAETVPTKGEADGQPTKASPPPMSFEEQMARLQRSLRGEPDPKSADKKPTHNLDGTPIPQPLPGAKPANPFDKTGDKTPDKNSDKPAEKPSDRFLDKSADKNSDKNSDKNTDRFGNPTSRGGSLDALTPEVLRGIKKVGEKKMEHFVTPPPAIGLDNADPEGYRVLMREGESLLAQGRFFDAEDRFVRSVAAAPGDPLARAGRVHAEIGAGLYLSAAANLRSLLTDHPELVSTRFSEKLLPSPERAKVIVEQLAAEEKKAESSLGRESALLLAYMGYQRSEDTLVTSGLADFEKRLVPGAEGEKDRALLALVKAAWMK